MTRRRRWPFVSALLAIGAVAGLLYNNQAEADRRDDARRREVLRYGTAISGPAKDGGFVVQEGLKRGLAQVANDQAGPVVFQAVSWVDRLKQVQADFRKAAKGLQEPRLRLAAKKFDDSFDLYVESAQNIGAAAIASGDGRAQLLEKAADHGRGGDKRYDEASALFQEVRRSVGLEPLARFPDPTTRDG